MSDSSASSSSKKIKKHHSSDEEDTTTVSPTKKASNGNWLDDDSSEKKPKKFLTTNSSDSESEPEPKESKKNGKKSSSKKKPVPNKFLDSEASVSKSKKRKREEESDEEEEEDEYDEDEEEEEGSSESEGEGDEVNSESESESESEESPQKKSKKSKSDSESEESESESESEDEESEAEAEEKLAELKMAAIIEELGDSLYKVMPSPQIHKSIDVRKLLTPRDMFTHQSPHFDKVAQYVAKKYQGVSPVDSNSIRCYELIKVFAADVAPGLHKFLREQMKLLAEADSENVAELAKTIPKKVLDYTYELLRDGDSKSRSIKIMKTGLKDRLAIVDLDDMREFNYILDLWKNNHGSFNKFDAEKDEFISKEKRDKKKAGMNITSEKNGKKKNH